MKLKITKAYSYLVVLFISTSAVAQYSIAKSVFGSGVESMQNRNYKINATIGQTTIGSSKNSVQQNQVGFWYQVNVVITEVELESDDLLGKYQLYQNYPNPFNPQK